MDRSKIRNFSIIAHIDHGKSTLADRILEYTGTVSEREKKDQFLDQMDLERERGITIKLQTVRINYRAEDSRDYVLNLIDTPGHVDFAYEVSRSLAACEGALLVVDASQGIEAQTMANALLAMEHDLVLIPVINKIDLPQADPEGVKSQIEDVLGLDTSTAVLASAKQGTGVKEILEAIVTRVSPPGGEEDAPARALIFDSHYDSYRGVVGHVRVVDGHLENGMNIRLMATGAESEVGELGVFAPFPRKVEKLGPGEVGYVITGLKSVRDVRVGDTVTAADNPAAKPLPGYRKMKPMVYCGLYPQENADYEDLRDALEKLQLNDAALWYEPETSDALGFGFRCGFLGLLHKEIVQERLEREYELSLVSTAPNVVYKVATKDGELYIDNPASFPGQGDIIEVGEPYVECSVVVPGDFVGNVMKTFEDKRGEYRNMQYLSSDRVVITYHLPLSEIIYDFFDQLKSRTRGYASLDYEVIGYRKSNLVKLEIWLGGEPVDALSTIVHRDDAYARGRELVAKLRKLIPRHLFDIPVQAVVGSKVIARETVKALRKDVLAKCYGGDVTRKRKLLERQKEGKKRMKQIGRIEVPQEAFMAILKTDE